MPSQRKPCRIGASAASTLRCGVGVVDPQQELPAVPPREQPIEQRRAHAADVQIAGRTGSETCADHECSQFRLRGIPTVWQNANYAAIAAGREWAMVPRASQKLGRPHAVAQRIVGIEVAR